jgi:hypothetical protein
MYLGSNEYIGDKKSVSLRPRPPKKIQAPWCGLFPEEEEA